MEAYEICATSILGAERSLYDSDHVQLHLELLNI